MTVEVAKGGKGNLSGRSRGTAYWIFGRLGKRLSSCNLLIITVTMMMMEVMRVRMVFTESETRAHWR